MSSLTFPMRVDHGTQMQVLVPARTTVLQALTGAAGLRVVEITPGWTALALVISDHVASSLEPHSQMLVAWPVRFEPLWHVPALPIALGARLKDFGWWVYDAPASRAVAVEMGRSGWGLPSREARFRLGRAGDAWRAEVRDGHALLASLQTGAGRPDRQMAQQLALFSRQGTDLLRTPVRLEGMGTVRPPGTRIALELGEDPVLLPLGAALTSRPWVLALRYYHDFHTALWPARQRTRLGPDLAQDVSDWAGDVQVPAPAGRILH